MSTPSKSSLRALPGYFNGPLLLSVILIAISQVNFGFDQGVFTSTQAMTAFTEKFGVYNVATKVWAIEPYFLSLLNSLTYCGFAFGIVTGSFISRKWGRRAVLIAMCGWAIVGAIILVTARVKEQMLAGRIIAYVYIGMELAVVPVLQSELVPAQVRGFVVGTYQIGILLGQLIGALICRGTSDIKGDASWRIPMGLLFVIPCFILCAVWFMPESPRWYLLNNRDEEALASLTKLRRGRFTPEQIQKEFQDLKSTVNLVVEKGRFVELFQGSNLRRTLIVIGTNVMLQLTGQNFVSVYGTIFIKSLGTVNPFSMTSINSGINIVVVLLVMYLSDVTGRVPLMIIGAIVQCAALFTMGGLGTVATPSMAIKQAVTAMVTIFGTGFCIGWAPLSHVVVAEIPTLRLRDQTYALGAIFNIIIQFAVSFSIPYLLYAPYAALGSKVGLIFGSFAFVAILFSAFCIPECGGKTLEEIDRLFVSGTPIRKFRHAHSTIEEQNPEALDQEKGMSERVITVHQD